MYGHRFLGASKAVVERSRNAQLSFLAASLAYYMLVSLFPLGLLAFVVASTVGGEAFADAVLGTVSAFLSPSGTALLDEALRAGAGRGGATVVGIALLLWSGLRLFRGLDVAFTLAYGRNDPGSLASQLLDATAALLGIAVAVVALAVVNGALAAAGRELTDLAGTAVLVVSLFVAFYPFYYLFPDVEMAYRDAVPGAIFAALGWTVLGATFTFYAANAGAFALYGAVGAILLLVTWFYVAGIVLLLGAVINAVLGTAPTGETAHPRTVFTEAQGGDRQGQKGAARNVTTMSDERATPDADADPVDRRAGDATANDAEVERLREELAALRTEVDEKSLPREELESDLRRYVRARVRRGHARGWGPYLVLLYGTAMTLGAFYYLDGLTAIFAMFVVWLSTLGLYALMLLLGLTGTLVSLPGRVLDRLRDFRG